MPDLLIEIGTEEIPASYLEPALAGLERSLLRAFAGARLSCGSPSCLGTARRMTIHFPAVSERSEDLTEERLGPAARIAYDADGEPTKAALGFARSQGVDPGELRVVETEKGTYVAATVSSSGEPAAEVVARALPPAIASVPFPKSMRWTGSSMAFARPIRGLVVILGEEVVPVAVAGLVAGRQTTGHGFLAPGPISLESADLETYRSRLREAKVIADVEERRGAIRGMLESFLGPDHEPVHEDLLEEVTNLVEWPGVLEGAIDPAFLKLPVEVLEVAMRVHLRFFPVLSKDGGPEPRFLSVTNRGTEVSDTVREGNERVLHSRLSDARFFLAEDSKRKLEDRVSELGDKTLHRELGSYRDKAERLAEISASLAEQLGWKDLEDRVRRAALLAKADLVTEMVGEFPELQGTVGRIYAIRDGEEPEVAEAVEDHYRPRGPADELPRGRVACVVALAEKLDNLASFFKIGGAPTGSSDPFGLRRQALGLIRIATEKKLSFSLGEALIRAMDLCGTAEEGELRDRVLGFVRDRLYQTWVDAGHRYDLVRAALSAGFDDLPDFGARVTALHAVSGEVWWPRLVEVVERTHNILRGQAVPAHVDPGLISQDEERAVLDAVDRAEPRIRELLNAGGYEEAARIFTEEFADVVHAFFEKVFVNVEDSAVRSNRIALLGRVNALFAATVADLSTVERGGEDPTR